MLPLVPSLLLAMGPEETLFCVSRFLSSSVPWAEWEDLGLSVLQTCVPICVSLWEQNKWGLISVTYVLKRQGGSLLSGRDDKMAQWKRCSSPSLMNTRLCSWWEEMWLRRVALWPLHKHPYIQPSLRVLWAYIYTHTMIMTNIERRKN